MRARVDGDLGAQARILARCDGNKDLEHNERFEREVINATYLPFFTMRTILFIVLPRQEGVRN